MTHPNDPHGFEPRKWELLHEVMAEADRQKIAGALPDKNGHRHLTRHEIVYHAAYLLNLLELAT